MNSNSSNWLITFSDLFFILVSFFILRHQMIELPAISTLSGKSIIPMSIEPDVPSLFTEREEKTEESITIPIYHSWFSSPEELSSQGEEGILHTTHYLTDERLALGLHLHYPASDDPTSSLKKRTITIIGALKKKGIIPKTLKISRHRMLEEPYIGSLELIIKSQD